MAENIGRLINIALFRNIGRDTMNIGAYGASVREAVEVHSSRLTWLPWSITPEMTKWVFCRCTIRCENRSDGIKQGLGSRSLRDAGICRKT